MTWCANQIYARSTPEVIAALRTQPFLAGQLYHVDDLRGVRCESTLEILRADEPPSDRMRHGLPPGGLLVASPEIYKTSYDLKEPDIGDFERHYRHNTPWPQWPPGAKWESVQAPEDTEVFFPRELDPEQFSLGILRFLKWVYSQTSSPLVWYECGMWGGDVEHETAWIMDATERVYQFKKPDRTIEYTVGKSRTPSTSRRVHPPSAA